MLIASQILFLVLLFACAAMAAYALYQLYRFDSGSRIARLSGIIALLGSIFSFLFSIYAGLGKDDPESFPAFFITNVFDRSGPLLMLCALLACGLTVAALLIFKSRKPDFALSGLRIDEENTLHFTLTSPRSTVFRIQSLYLNVIDANPLRQSTFPYYGEGAEAPQRTRGFVHLEAKPGLYRVETEGNVESNLGGGKEPSDFSIRVSCEPGFRYSVRLEVDWFDTLRPKREDRYSFEDQETQIDSPVEWEDLVSGSREVKVLFYKFVGNLIADLRSLKPAPRYTILVADDVPTNEDGQPLTLFGEPINELDEHVTYIPGDAEETIVNLVGRVPYWERPRNFLLIYRAGSGATRRVLVLQDEGLERAEIVENEEHIAEIEKAYDSLAERFIGQHPGL